MHATKTKNNGSRVHNNGSKAHNNGSKAHNTPARAQNLPGIKAQNTASRAQNVPKAHNNASKARNVPKAGNKPFVPHEPCLGTMIESMIQRRGLSFGEAAEQIGMSKQQLFRIIRIHEDPDDGGVPNPGILTVQRIVPALGFGMHDLFVKGDLVNARTGEEW